MQQRTAAAIKKYFFIVFYFLFFILHSFIFHTGVIEVRGLRRAVTLVQFLHQSGLLGKKHNASDAMSAAHFTQHGAKVRIILQRTFIASCLFLFFVANVHIIIYIWYKCY